MPPQLPAADGSPLTNCTALQESTCFQKRGQFTAAGLLVSCRNQITEGQGSYHITGITRRNMENNSTRAQEGKTCLCKEKLAGRGCLLGGKRIIFVLKQKDWLFQNEKRKCTGHKQNDKRAVGGLGVLVCQLRTVMYLPCPSVNWPRRQRLHFSLSCASSCFLLGFWSLKIEFSLLKALHFFFKLCNFLHLPLKFITFKIL